MEDVLDSDKDSGLRRHSMQFVIYMMTHIDKIIPSLKEQGVGLNPEFIHFDPLDEETPKIKQNKYIFHSGNPEIERK